MFGGSLEKVQKREYVFSCESCVSDRDVEKVSKKLNPSQLAPTPATGEEDEGFGLSG